MKNIIIILSLAIFASATIPNYSQTQTFLNSHNTFRMNVYPPASYMPLLSWSSALSTSSNIWVTKCKWGHSGTPNVGENVYATSVRTPNAINFDPSKSVNSWGSEKQYYNYASNSCSSGQICGHYTQIIWANSLNVGCAFQDCAVIQGLSWPNGGTLVTCQYLPPGNWWGEKPYH